MIKKKLCKIFLIPLLVFGILGIHFEDSHAASFSVSASSSTVKPGQSFTVTVKAAGAGSFSASVSNGSTSGLGWVDGSASFTVTAGQSGTTTVTVTALDATGYDETPITGSKSVSVSIKSPEAPKPPAGNTGTTPPKKEEVVDTRSKDNNLSSLTVSQGTLSPEFNASVKSYSVDLTSDISTLTINAKAKDSKATIKGTGEKSLVIGSQTFEIVVTAENGSRKTYTITVNVTEKPTVFTKLNDQNLGLLTELSKVKAPDGYKGQNVELEGQTIQGFVNDKTQLTLVYLMSDDGSKNFYIYEDGKVIKKYETITIQGKEYVLLDIPESMQEQDGLTRSKVKLLDLEIDGWVYNDENHHNYSIVYLLNAEGEKVLYSFEGTEGTLQKYTPFVEESTSTVTYVLAATSAIFMISTISLLVYHLRFKKKSISAIKDYYDKKHQGE